MSGVSVPVLATSVFFAAFLAFGAGHLMSPPPVRTGDSRPIIDPDAWNKTAPVQLGFKAQAQQTVVDVAMEEAADAVDKRGWIAPDDLADASYRDEIQPLEISSNSYTGSYTVEALEGASASPTDHGTAIIQVLEKAEADRAWDNWSTTTNNNQQPIIATPISVTH